MTTTRNPQTELPGLSRRRDSLGECVRRLMAADPVALRSLIEHLHEAAQIDQGEPVHAYAIAWARVSGTIAALVTLTREREPETIEDATGTCGCPECSDSGMAETGGDPDCLVLGCYRGRVSGYHDRANAGVPDTERGPVNEPDYTIVPCSLAQQDAVDRWLEVLRLEAQ